MPYFTDALQCVQLLFGADAFHVERVEIAVDEFDGFEDAAGGLALPHFTEAAAANGLDQAIAWDGFGVRLPQPAHGSILRSLLGPALSLPMRPDTRQQGQRRPGKKPRGADGSPLSSPRRFLFRKESFKP